MTGLHQLVAAASTAGDTATSWQGIVRSLAETVTALTVLLGAGWWLVGPRVRGFVSEQRDAAQLVRHELQPNSGGSLHDHARRAADSIEGMADQLDRVVGRIRGVEQQLTDHLRAAHDGLARLDGVERRVDDLGHVVGDVVKAQRAELTVYRALLAGAGVLTPDEAPLAAFLTDHREDDPP